MSMQRLKKRLRAILNRKRASNRTPLLRRISLTACWYTWYFSGSGRQEWQLSGDALELLWANPDDQHPWSSRLSQIKRSANKVYLVGRGERENAERQLRPILTRHGIEKPEIVYESEMSGFWFSFFGSRHFLGYPNRCSVPALIVTTREMRAHPDNKGMTFKVLDRILEIGKRWNIPVETITLSA